MFRTTIRDVKDHSKSFLWTRNPSSISMSGRRGWWATSRESARGIRRTNHLRACTVQNWEWPGNNKQKWQRSECGQTSDGHRFGAGPESASASSLLFRERRYSRRTYIQLGWAASDAFSRSSRSQGSNRGHMTLQSSVNIARDPVSLHRIVGACACGVSLSCSIV